MADRRPDRVLGPGHDTFWEWCGKDELRLQRCDRCGHMPWPVVQACERCGGTRFGWERLSGRGRLVSWCTFEHDYYKGLFPPPHETVLVELADGPLFVSTPDDFALAEATPGMAVAVRFIDAEDSIGPFRLPVFVRG